MNTTPEFQKSTARINKAFYRMEMFMRNGFGKYEYFGFATKFNELFREAKQLDNYTPETRILMQNYWLLIETFIVDIWNGDWNLPAFNSENFKKDFNEVRFDLWDSLQWEDFLDDEFHESNAKGPQVFIHQLMSSNDPSAQMLQIDQDKNPHPRYFKDAKAWGLFKCLMEDLKETAPLREVSFIYRAMQRDNFIYPDIGESAFRAWLRKNNIAYLESQLLTYEKARTHERESRYIRDRSHCIKGNSST